MDRTASYLQTPVSGIPSESDSGEDLGRLMDTFLESLDIMESSRKTYMWGMSRYFGWLRSSGRTLRTVTPADVVKFKSELLKGGLSPLTVDSYITVVRRFYGWTETNMLYPNIARSVHSPKARAGKGRMYLTDDEAVRLLEHMKAHSLRNYAMVNLMLRTGLRTLEVSRADVGDICRMKGHRILKVWGKGHVTRDSLVILNDPTWKPLKEYLDFRGRTSPSDALFVTDGKGHRGERLSTRQVQYICKEGMRAVGLDGHGYSAHSLRHTTAVHILKNGGDWMAVQRVLRHASPATSQIYTRAVEDEIRLERNPESLLDTSFTGASGDNL